MIKYFETFNGEVTAYNLLEFYLVNILKNRFKPSIAVAGQPMIYDLDKFLSSGEANNIHFDIEHFFSVGELPNYLTVFQKLKNLKSEYDIFAKDYGLAMAICLNELKNRGLIEKHKERFNSNNTNISI